MSTIKKIHLQTSNCDACQAVSVKMITNEEIQSPNLRCKDCECGQYSENGECKEDIPIKRLACDQIQSVNASPEECNKAFMLNNEEIHLSTVNFSGEALVIKTDSDQRQSLNGETNIASEGCPTEMSTNENSYSRSSLCNCQEEILLSVLNLSSGPLPTKAVSVQSQSLSCETHACQGCSTKMSTDEEIHSRSSCSDTFLTKMSNVVELSSIDEALFKQLLSDSERTMCQSQSSSKTCIPCEFSKKMLTDEPLLPSSRFNNKALSTKTCSDQNQSLSCESSIPEPPAKISTDEETYSRSSICEALLKTILPTEEIHLASPSERKMITNEEIQSPNLRCKDRECGQYSENSECKEDIPIKRLACDQIQSANASPEECKQPFMLNNEEIHLSTVNFSGEALVIKTDSDERQSLNGETNIASEGCPTEMSINENIFSRSSLCNCQDEILLSVLNLSSGPLPTKTVSVQSQSLSCETHACQGCSTKMSTDEEIHSRSSCSDTFLTKMSNVVELSSIDEALFKQLLSDSERTMCQSQSSSKTCIPCEFSKKILTDEALLSSSRFNNKALSTKTCSDQNQSLSGESRIPEPPAEISTDEETYSRSSICEALLKTILPTEEIHLASPSCSDEVLSTKMLSDQGQSLHYGTRVAYEGSLPKMSTETSKSLCCKGHLLTKKSLTDSPNAQIRAMRALSPLDPSSYSRPELAIIKHISLNLNVDFETHVLSGQAKLDFDVLHDINDLILDASNLKIESIQAEDGTPLLFEMGQHLPNMGSKLIIFLPQQLTAGKQVTVKIKYSTDPQASALQWLDPEQTSGKKHPYLFSQCQPIHARSILPCQDTPAVKFTYDAEVTAPEEFTVLMSALRGEQRSNKTTFRQPMPLPSYLVALAVGMLESRTLGPRSKVWSEKEEIERSAWEFSETEKYLQAAEKLCGPYEWTQYDLLVLPPSFPYGGMENPCLTFVTPTLLAGDRSQADVIVHEIMHSWTGNLVTNRNFEHFWLNEGFTVFLERKVGASLINDSVEAKRSRDFQSLLGLQELNEAVNDVLGPTNKLTALVVDLSGVHPDDAFSTVPYEKGSLFLRYLEDLSGGPEVFDDFLRAYLTKFRKKSLDTIEFQRFFVNYFKDNVALKSVDWDLWLYKPGMPPIIPAYDTTMTKAISALIVKIDDPSTTLSHEDVETFTPHQMIHMLQQLIDRPALPLDRLATLGTEYRVNGNKNTEILYRWLRLCIRSRDQSNISEVFNFVNSQGRMKYVRPIYRDLYAWEDIRQQAIDNFLKNEKYMMHVSAYTLRKDLHLEENATTE